MKGNGLPKALQISFPTRDVRFAKSNAPPRLPDSESGPSAIRVQPHARELVHPAGLSPANSPFEAEDDNNFTTDAKMEPMERAFARGHLHSRGAMRPAVYETAVVVGDALAEVCGVANITLVRVAQALDHVSVEHGQPSIA